MDGSELPESWNAQSSDLENLLFTERGITRRLRSSKSGFAHTKINLVTSGQARRTGRTLNELRQALLGISNNIPSA